MKEITILANCEINVQYGSQSNIHEMYSLVCLFWNLQIIDLRKIVKFLFTIFNKNPFGILQVYVIKYFIWYKMSPRSLWMDFPCNFRLYKLVRNTSTCVCLTHFKKKIISVSNISQGVFQTY